MDKVVVIGGGGHAVVVLSLIKKMVGVKAMGYIDPVNQGVLLDTEYLGDDQHLDRLFRAEKSFVAALGVGMLGVEGGKKRELILKKISDLKISFPVLSSPDSIINEAVSIGRGAVIFDGAVINSRTSIGEGVILNTRSSIDHDCQIGNYVHVAPGVTVSGGVQIGDHSFIGAGSTIIQNVTIAPGVLVGAGSTVVTNLLEPGVYFGSPAKRVR